MDAFFASVEQRDNPSLRGKPLVVGRNSQRSVVATASYEARAFGIHSAMSIRRAKQLCKDLIIVEPHFEKYKEVSQIIRSLMKEYTDIIEPISLDEAFMDVTHNKKGEQLAINIAKELKNKILWETLLTSSAGVSYNKFLAKIASDWNKPNGLKVIHPLQSQKFIDNLKIEKIWGVGPKTLIKMHSLGIYTGKQLRDAPLLELTRHFGKMGKVFYDYARGIDERKVENQRVRKSVSCEHTLEKDIYDTTSVVVAIYGVVLDLVCRINEVGFRGKRLTLKIKYHDFTIQTRSIAQKQILVTKEQIFSLAKQLATQIPYKQKPVRLVGLGVSEGELQSNSFHELELLDRSV